MWPLSSITDSPGDRALEWAQVARARPSELKYQYLLIYETSWHEVLVCVCQCVCIQEQDKRHKNSSMLEMPQYFSLQAPPTAPP